MTKECKLLRIFPKKINHIREIDEFLVKLAHGLTIVIARTEVLWVCGSPVQSPGFCSEASLGSIGDRAAVLGGDHVLRALAIV